VLDIVVLIGFSYPYLRVRVPVPNPEWRFPIRLVTSGRLGELWGSKDLKRGNGVAIALLPILALHVTPEAGKAWTGWYRLPYRDFAEPAGISHNSVAKAIARLQGADLFQKQTRARVGDRLTHVLTTPGRNGPRKRRRIVLYRISAELYLKGDEPYVTLPASRFVGGTWADLGSGARVLYLVLQCLQEVPEKLSLAEIEALTGLPRRTFDRALKTLQERTGKDLVAPRTNGRPRKQETSP
jgi:hypothetical protein